MKGWGHFLLAGQVTSVIYMYGIGQPTDPLVGCGAVCPKPPPFQYNNGPINVPACAELETKKSRQNKMECSDSTSIPTLVIITTLIIFTIILPGCRSFWPGTASPNKSCLAPLLSLAGEASLAGSSARSSEGDLGERAGERLCTGER